MSVSRYIEQDEPEGKEELNVDSTQTTIQKQQL
jgi:hypothetical protein